jgi:hypothetical protein
MLMKALWDLKEGDVLKKKTTYELCTLKQIINGDIDDKQKNFGFTGFFAKEKVLKKLFCSIRENICTYNDESIKN